MVVTRSRPSSATSETGGAAGARDDVVVVPDPPSRRWTTVAWCIGLAVIAGLSIWSSRTTTFGPRADANVASGAPGCALVEGIDASGTISGRSIGSFRADAGGPAGSCASGVEPTVAVVLTGSTSASASGDALPGSALAGATTLELDTVAHPTLRVELLRSTSPVAVADVVRVSDGERTVSVATIWSSVDPIDGTGPGNPDVDGAVALAEAVLAA